MASGRCSDLRSFLVFVPSAPSVRCTRSRLTLQPRMSASVLPCKISPRRRPSAFHNGFHETVGNSAF